MNEIEEQLNKIELIDSRNEDFLWTLNDHYTIGHSEITIPESIDDRD